jgi:uncharacterized protein YbjT (DUF2867 family)
MSGKSDKKIALVFGASGLVGKVLVRELIDNDSYASVVIFIRKPLEFKHPKVMEQVIDFDRLEENAALLTGDELFICLGTTIKKAGSVSAVEKIDRDLPVGIARLAFNNGVKRVAVVSSLGANPAVRNFYLRIKGEMERGIREIPFEQIVIARPSMLLGDRAEFRFGEAVGKMVMKAVNVLLTGSLRKYRGIEGRAVAKAMIGLMVSGLNDVIYESDVLQKWADKGK